MHRSSRRLRLWDYFALEAVHAGSIVLFLLCAFFWAKGKFGYTDTENLLLAAANGLGYVIGAGLGGRIADRVGYDRTLAWCLAGMAAVMLLGWIPSWHYTPFVVVALYSLLFGPTWPAIEAAILRSAGSASVPDRLGLFNVIWAFGDGVGFFLSGPLYDWQPDSILWVPGALHIAQWLWLKRPVRATMGNGTAASEVPHRGDSVARPVKRRFMHQAWLANGLATFMVGAFAALTPQMGERLGLSASFAIWLACALLFARGVAFLVLWKWTAWHYRAGWGYAAIWTAPLCLAVVFFSSSQLLIFGALSVFGAAIGLSYYASIYYSLDYGESSAEHGGFHEAVLGVGGFLGPLAAAGAAQIGGGARPAQWTVVVLCLVISGVGLGWVRRANAARR